jgi:hypothetical protein
MASDTPTLPGGSKEIRNNNGENLGSRVGSGQKKNGKG